MIILFLALIGMTVLAIQPCTNRRTQGIVMTTLMLIIVLKGAQIAMELSDVQI